MKFSAVAVAVCVGFAASPASAMRSNYMDSIAGGSAAKPPSGSPFLPKKPVAVPPPVNGGYLGNVAQANGVPANGTPVPPSYSSPASGAPATTGSYLEQMGGGAKSFASSGPKTSYAPTKSNVNKKSGGSGFGSYLDGFGSGSGSASPAQPSYNSPSAQSAPPANTGSYLEQMAGGARSASSGPKTSYAPTKSNVSQKSGGSGFGSYLDGFGSAAPAQPSYSAAPAQPSYSSQPAAPIANSGPKTSYAPTKSQVGRKSGGSGMGSYLDHVGSSGAPSQHSYNGASAQPQQAAAPAANAGSYLEQMGGGASSYASSGPKTSYAPTKKKW